jgi:hypothetical protein
MGGFLPGGPGNAMRFLSEGPLAEDRPAKAGVC